MKPNQQEILTAIFLALFIICLLPLKAQAQNICQTPPHSNQLNQLFVESLTKIPQKSKTRLLILPFEDGSQLSSPDSALSKAFAVSLYDLLSLIGQIGLFHPTISMNMTKDSQSLFNETQYVTEAKNLNATHMVVGLFQKQDINLRLFIKIIDVNSGKQIDSTREYALLENDRFFSIMADVATDILRITAGTKVNSSLFADYLIKSPSFEAYRYYIKGIEKSFSYDPVLLEVAKAWFEKAVMLSYNFSDALLEKKRVLWMLSLYQRQMRKDVSLLLAEANSVSSKPITIGKGLASKLTAKRWEQAFKLANEASYATPQKAISLLNEAIQLTPEDSWLYYEYASRLKQAGKPFNDALGKASQINSCIPTL